MRKLAQKEPVQMCPKKTIDKKINFVYNTKYKKMEVTNEK